MKLRIYQFYFLSLLSWPFLIDDFDWIFMIHVQEESNEFLKKWAGSSTSTENGLVYRSKENFDENVSAKTNC